MFVQGMNFKSQWSVQHNSDLLFWEIAIPVMIVVVIIFFWSELGRAFERLQKRMRIEKVNLDPPLSPLLPVRWA